MTNVLEAYANFDGLESPANLSLMDMILTQEPFAVRQVTQVGESVFALCSESNKVSIMQHNPALKAQQNLQAQAQLLKELEEEL